jgi:hypothetical protein
MIIPVCLLNPCWRVRHISPLVANIINSRQLDAVLCCRYKPETLQSRQVVRYEGSVEGREAEEGALAIPFQAARTKIFPHALCALI